jgi:Flp pilus assembly protein TadG
VLVVKRVVSDERGGVLVLVLLALPVLVLVMSLVLDVGNWLEHKRHLQVQADAAAFAGGDAFTAACSNTAVKDTAKGYSGAFSPTLAGVDNSQVGGTPYSRMHMQINSRTYFNQSSPVDATVNTADPCQASMIDVKLTESDVPWFFKLAGVPHINAHARVEIRQETTAKGALPVAVQELNPKSAKAIFIDEANPSTVLASVPLTKAGTANGLQLWDNATAPVRVPISVARVGVRIVVSGSSSTTCGDPLVACYDLTGANGLLFVQGYDGSTSGARPHPPVVRDVALVPSGSAPCADRDFVDGSATCTAKVSANIDFGTGTTNPTSSLGASVTAKANGTTIAGGLSFNTTSHRWESGSFSIAAGAGAVPITLDWAETATGTITGYGTCATNKNPCHDTFGTVQRIFSATSSASGQVALAAVCDSAGLVCDKDSFARGTSQSLVVRIGLSGNLADAQSAGDPTHILRLADPQQNQALDCGGANLRDQLANGCTNTYTVNTGQACSGSIPGPPYPCVATAQGFKTGQMNGLTTRLFSSNQTCSLAPNNWASFPNLPPGDPRVIQVFLTPFGAYTGNGSGQLPVSGFASFYVTNFDGDPCDSANPGPQKGEIWGHFIKYISSLNDGSGGTTTCDMSSLGTCVAMLTE